MGYTFIPKERHGKASGSDIKMSTKHARILCAVIRGKKLKIAQRLLSDLADEKRDLEGKYYTNAANHMKILLESCAANCRSMGLDDSKLFVHASCHEGMHFRRRRRKAKFGSRMKRTHVEIMLIERGKGGIAKPEKKPAAEKKLQDTQTKPIEQKL